MSTTPHDLIALLSVERRPVAALWQALGISRPELIELITSHRDELAQLGIMLHVATVSQASAARLHIEIDGKRYASISRPAGRASAAARYVASYLESMQATAAELREIRAVIDHQLAGLAAVEAKTTPAESYRQEFVKCGKAGCTKCQGGPGHGPYWYAYHRESGRLKKRYLGKTAPDQDRAD